MKIQVSQEIMGQAVIQKNPFGLVGEFLGFVITKYSHPRAIKLRWLDQEIVVKLAKDLRDDYELNRWIPGMQVQVWGTQRLSQKRSQVKFKAHRILSFKTDFEEALVPSAAMLRLASPVLSEPLISGVAPPKPIVLKVCTKSDCRVRGSQELCTILKNEITKGSWDQPVTIREIGCIGKCKSGPHLIVLPEKVTYSNLKPDNLKPDDLPKILDRHLKHLT